MYMPRPVPPRTPCFQNLVNTRVRIDSGMPSPSSSTRISTPANGSVIPSTVTFTRPSPCRIALSTTLVTTCDELVGVGEDLRHRFVVRRLDRARGPRPDRLDAALDQRLGVDVPGVQRQPPGVDAGHVEQLGDQPREPFGVGVDRGQHQLLLLVVEPLPLAQQGADEALHPGERRPQLVRHGGDQVGAVAVEAGPSAARADHQRHALDGAGPPIAVDPPRDQHLGAVAWSTRSARSGRPGWGGLRRAGCWRTSHSSPGPGAPSPPTAAGRPRRSHRAVAAPVR